VTLSRVAIAAQSSCHPRQPTPSPRHVRPANRGERLIRVQPADGFFHIVVYVARLSRQRPSRSPDQSRPASRRRSGSRLLFVHRRAARCLASSSAGETTHRRVTKVPPAPDRPLWRRPVSFALRSTRPKGQSSGAGRVIGGGRNFPKDPGSGAVVLLLKTQPTPQGRRRPFAARPRPVQLDSSANGWGISARPSPN